MPSIDRVAVIGAGPAGIYAADILTKNHPTIEVDILDKLPTPFGLVRYGVAPDHPRIKQIIKALHRVCESPRIRFFGNVEFGKDVTAETLKTMYRATIFATGANHDNPLNIPGAEADQCFGASDFVDWYDAHPDAPTQWPLTAKSVAIIGAGNVALDVARMLAKPVAEQMSTDIPEQVRAGLSINQARDIHIFARRGPAHVKFTPVELRELSHSPSVDVLVEGEGFEIDNHAQKHLSTNKSSRLVADTLYKYLDNKPTEASRTIHIHLCQQPVEILTTGTQVTGLKTERTTYQDDGSVAGTGVFVTTEVQAVYGAIGYRPTALPGVPFDSTQNVISNSEGRVLTDSGIPATGLYATGWIKRGPVGLIGHTKSDASQTVTHLLNDLDNLPQPATSSADALTQHLDKKGVDWVSWDGWLAIDQHEQNLGAAANRERIKLASRPEMLEAAKKTDHNNCSAAH